MANGGWSSFNPMPTSSRSSMGFMPTAVAGVTATGEVLIPSSCAVNTAVAGVTAGTGTCFGPPFFAQRLASLRGIPVILCVESGHCFSGQIMQVCADYIEFNCDGTLVEIPLWQITRVQLASSNVTAS